MISHALVLKISIKIRELKQKYSAPTDDKKAVLLLQLNWTGRTADTLLEKDSDLDGHE